MIWEGSGALSHGTYVASAMQQRIQKIRVMDLSDANGMMKDLKDLKTIMKLPRSEGEAKTISIKSFSDGAFNICNNNQYGQAGIIKGLEYEAWEG